MSDELIPAKAFELLGQLRANNNRAWYSDHKAAIRQHAQEPFMGLIDSLNFAFEVHDIPLRGSSKTMFRLYRDIRFSKDKSPFNSHISGVLTPGGTKSEGRGAMYLRIDPDGGTLGCGHFMLQAKSLAPMRQLMLDAPERWERCVDAVEQARFELQMTDSLTHLPRGFKEAAGHPLEKFIKLKTLAVIERHPAKTFIDGSIIDRAVALAQASAPLLSFRDIAQRRS